MDILDRYWSRRGRYRRLNAETRIKKKMKIKRLGDGSKSSKSSRRFWRFKKSVVKLKFRSVSPLKMWTKFKNAYMNMMLNISDRSVGNNVLGAKRIPGGRTANRVVYSVEKRLVYEICLALRAAAPPV